MNPSTTGYDTIVGGTNLLGSTGAYRAFSVNFNGITNPAQLSGMFELYRIDKVVWYFTLVSGPDPRENAWVQVGGQYIGPDPGEDVTNARFWPVMYASIDKNDVTKEADLATFLERNPRRIPMSPGRTIKISCVPGATTAGQTASTSVEVKKQWYGCTGTAASISHFGLKTYFDFATENNTRIDVKCKVFLSLKGLR